MILFYVIINYLTKIIYFISYTKPNIGEKIKSFLTIYIDIIDF